ncbi:hypothetical protein C0991_004815 [Blastosporella zonata]|nr:hypothetical protein C0991_004815 [Blastosporella zonata]
MDRDDGWRATLLSYGLVCKAWSPVVELFFEGFEPDATRVPGFRTLAINDKPVACRVARSLEARPERGSLIRAFATNYFIHPSAHVSMWDCQQQWHSFAFIMGHANPQLLKIVRILHPIHPDVAKDVLRILEALCGVESFVLVRPGFDMDTIQEVMSKWPRLHELILHEWSAFDKDTQLASFPALSFQLETLDLYGGEIKGHQMMRFVTMPNPRLRVLSLMNLTGLLNNEFATLLTTVAPTLEELQINHCQFLRATDDEEFAIDTVMPQFAALKRLIAIGVGLVSALAISRKQPYSADPAAPYLVIDCGSEETFKADVMLAIEHGTEWGTVHVISSNSAAYYWRRPASGSV